MAGDEVVLRQDGKTLRMRQTVARKGAWRVEPAKGPNVWDSANKGCSQLLFTVLADADGAADLAVSFSAE